MISSDSRLLAEARRAQSLSNRILRDLQRTTSLTVGAALSLLTAVVFWLIGRIVAGAPMYLMAYGTVGLTGVAYMASRRKLDLEAHRSDVRPRMREGEVIDVTVELRANRAASNLVLEETMPSGLGQTVRAPIAALKPGETSSHTYQLQCWRRGAYTIGPLVARFGDAIGLTLREQVIADSFEIVVHPIVERVSDRPLTRQFEDPPIRPPVSKPWPSGLEFYGMRDFRPGDDLRRIVWRAVARTGRIMVREAEQGITDRITLMINTNPAGYGGTPDYSPGFEMAVRAAASLGVRHLREGYAVTTEVNELRLTPALRGSPSQMRFLDALARLEPGQGSLSRVLERQIGNNQRDSHNVLITARLSRQEAAQLQLVVRRGVSVLVVVIAYEQGFQEAAHNAAAIGCQVVEVRPNVSLAAALSAEIGAGSGRR